MPRQPQTRDRVPGPPTVGALRVEYTDGSVLGIGEPAPRLSWTTSTASPGWLQAAYELEVDGVSQGRVQSAASVFVAWPSAPLRSRERRRVRVRVWGVDGSVSPWSGAATVEAGLLARDDWRATWIASTGVDDARPVYFRRTFGLARPLARARLYATSAGVNRLFLNGHRVGTTVLAPGWTAYGKRIRYETHDVTHLLTAGDNALGAVVADGWWRGHLGWEMRRNVYGDRLGLLAQLEVTYADGTDDVLITGAGWRTAPGPLLGSDLYVAAAWAGTDGA
jgi:alpha-L-rhamnosidase